MINCCIEYYRFNTIGNRWFNLENFDMLDVLDS